MAKQTINVGTTANDGTGDTLRLSQQKANNNFNDLYDNGGANITVVNPVTEANSTLNQALVDLNGGGGGSTPTLQEVLEEGNTTNETAIFGDIANDYLTVSSDNILIVDAENETSSSLTSSVFSIGDNAANYAQIDLINGFQTGNIETNNAYLKGDGLQISNPLAQSGLTANQLYFTNFDEENPASAVFSIDKLQTVSGEYLYPTGTSSPLATLDDIPAAITIDATPTDSSSNAVSSNGVFDALANRTRNVIEDTTSSSAVTGILNTLAKTYEIQGGAFTSNSAFKLIINGEKTGVAGTTTIRVYINTVNNFATATLIATVTSAAASIRDIPFSRLRSNFKGANLVTVAPATSTTQDITVGNNAVRTSIALNPANNFFVFVAIQNANAGDSTIIDSVNLTN